MSIFKRLFKIGEAEANDAINKLENPIKMAEQGVRDLKKDLENSLHSLAEIKAVAIRTRREVEESKAKSANYEKKAVQLVQASQGGNMDQAEADRLATEALSKKEQADRHVATLQKQLATHDSSIAKMEQNVQRLRSKISEWENEVKTLKARAKVSEASAKLNKQMAKIDSSSTITMLERMKEKVDSQEALAESYGEIAHENRSVDEEIDAALESSNSSGSDALAALKAKMASNN